jgi:dethiobiotin synthetase
MQKYFITAIGTEIGKTFVTAAIANECRQSKQPVRVLKPLLTGWIAEDQNMDARVLARACGLKDAPENWHEISPLRFSAPLAPSMAAELENKILTFAEIVEKCQLWLDQSHDKNCLNLIEGIGGVMTPLTKKHTVLDLMKELSLPVILVTGTYLGSLSHCLTAIKVLQHEKIFIDLIIINESLDSIGVQATKAALDEQVGIRNIIIPRQKTADNWQSLAINFADTLRRNIAGL